MSLNTIFTNIANAIRAKGVTGKMTPEQMASKIQSIKTNTSGGGGTTLQTVTSPITTTMSKDVWTWATGLGLSSCLLVRKSPLISGHEDYTVVEIAIKPDGTIGLGRRYGKTTIYVQMVINQTTTAQGYINQGDEYYIVPVAS